MISSFCWTNNNYSEGRSLPEVINVLDVVWNLEDALRVRREEAREEGQVKGRTEGLQISVRIIRELLNGFPAEEISKRYQVPISTVLAVKIAVLRIPKKTNQNL